MTVYEKPRSISDKPFHYCPGCGHGTAHKLIGEVIDELGILENTIGVMPVGCAVLGYDYFECDAVESAHGRAPAIATALKRCMPDKVVFSYQGDGDLAAIGTAETIHAAARGEAITVIFINNAIYGMTGGQMAPTSLEGQVTKTSPYGRDVRLHGYPIDMCAILAAVNGTGYIERCVLDTPAHIRAAKRAIKKAFENQINYGMYSFVELLSACPTNLKMTPADAVKHLAEMSEYYKPGVIKEKQV